MRVATLALAALVCAGRLSAAAQPDVASGAASSSAASTSATAPVPEVTVRARRADLARKVSKFVAQIAASDADEGLARWLTPVCPLVTGLPRRDGEFILERISDIAAAAGVPLGVERCRPNLFILVSADPTQLLEAMEKRNRLVTFGDATPSTVDQFIATPRAVRVWYNSQRKSPEGTDIAGGFPPGTQFLGGGVSSAPTYNDWERSSHLLSPTVRVLSYVYVIVDLKSLHQVTWGQLADYVTMVGLAQLKPGAHLGDARSILRLFDAAPQSAPAGATDWDQAFLKSLYATEQRSKMQRQQISRSMLRQIAP